MNAIEVFAILQKKIKSALSGIARIEETPTGFKIITNDGNSFSYTIPNFHKHDNKTDILDKLSISDVRHFEYSLIYLSSISFDYKVHSSWYSCNILASYKHLKGYFKVVFSDDFISLLDRTKQFYQVPNEVLNSDIRYYRHSVFIANYILLHKRRNKGKKTENVISVKELIKNCPLLPLYDELDKEQRQVYRSIIKPFDTNLKNACMFLGLNYRYDNTPKNYIDFTRSKIIFS